MASWYLFNSFIKKANCINITLKYLQLKIINDRFSKEEALFNN